MNFEEYIEKGIISFLPVTEQKDYVKFHKLSYIDDLNVSNKLISDSPRWSIISAYYAMHDITKLYLAKQHRLKISDRGVHTATIVALRKILANGDTKTRVINFLIKAKETYEVLNSLRNEKILPLILSKGKEEREKSQYYTQYNEKLLLTKSIEFLENISQPYIKIMERLLKNDF